MDAGTPAVVNTVSQHESGIVGDVGAKSLRLALTDAAGMLDVSSIRTYATAEQPTFSGVLSAFMADAHLPPKPRRCALAVAAVPRGDAITLAHSRMLISRTGVQFMMQNPPIILNECAASAWALSCGEGAVLHPITGQAPDPSRATGTFCLINIRNGLGVSILHRDVAGLVTVIDTEAGHSRFAPENDRDAEIERIVRRTVPRVSNEVLLAAPGLVAIRDAVAEVMGQSIAPAAPEEISRSAGMHNNPVATAAVAAYARALCGFAANLVLSYGAWEGVILSGKLPHAILGALRAPEALANFHPSTPYTRRLRDVPICAATFEYGELRGAARALYDSRVH